MKSKICFILVLLIISMSIVIPNATASSDTMTGEVIVYSNIDQKSAILTVIPQNQAGTILQNAEIFINGDPSFSGKGTISLPKGHYTVSSIDVIVAGTTLYAPKPKGIFMDGKDKRVEMVFTVNPTTSYANVYSNVNSTKESPGFDILLTMLSITSLLIIIKTRKRGGE